jgi:hypothetical protein
LRLIKPYFDLQLAEAVLAKRDPNIRQSHEDPFHAILEQIIVINCVMFAELNNLKR